MTLIEKKGWIKKYPPAKMQNKDILILIEIEIAGKKSFKIRIGYMKFAAGDRKCPHFIIPKYEDEKNIKKYKILGWQYLPDYPIEPLWPTED